jgi:hypothetical protein
VFSLRKIFVTGFFSALVCTTAFSQFYSGSQMTFGKNRVQYDHFNWTYFDFGTHKVYFYMGGDKLARYVGDKAKQYLNEMSSFLDYPIDGEVDFLVYNKQSEYAQSNLGLGEGEEYNSGGFNRIVGRKVILYFDGDHEKLNEQIRLGIAQTIFEQMMYGGSITNVIRGSTLLNIPAWFEQGFIYYMAYHWNTDIDNRIRDGILSGRYKNVNHLTGMDATYAGLSVWNYIAQTYGETVIPNVLYLARTSRSVESAFLFVLGTSVKSMSTEWYNYYMSQYKAESERESMPKQDALLKKPKKTRVYYHLKTSPDGRYVVYSSNQIGQDKVWLYDLQTKKTRRILKQGKKINRVIDFSYPLVAWHPSGELFSLIMEQQGKLMLYTYTLSNHKLQSRRIVNFQKILDFSYADDGTKFVMSAVQDGQTDIYVFTAASNGYEQITRDVYDDLNPRFIEHSTKIIFSSNRPDDTLRNGGDYTKMQEHTDIFEYNYATHSNALRRITNTPNIDETNPSGYSGNYVSYLSNASGIVNRYVAYIDSAISFVDTSAHYRFVVHSFPVTDYSRNILEQDASPSMKNYTQIMLYKGKYWMYQDTLPATPLAVVPAILRNTNYMGQFISEQKKKRADDSIARIKKDTATLIIKYPNTNPSNNKLPLDSLLKLRMKPVQDTTPQVKPPDTTHAKAVQKPIDINDYSFEPSTNNMGNNNIPTIIIPQVVKDTTPVVHKDTNRGPRHVLERENYHISFSPDYVVTQLDNSFLNQAYQVYTGGPENGPIIQNPGLDVFIKVGLTDLFEDYRIDGGVRISTDFTNNEYYLAWNDYSSRLDKELILHRAANTYTTTIDQTGNVYGLKTYTHDATYMLKWPFSEVARIEGSLGVRFDKYIVQATDIPSLEYPNELAATPNAQIAYVYDATLPVEPNIRYGLRAKFFAQYYRNINAPSEFYRVPNAGMYVLGMDIRYYQKISRDLIWANRLAASTSFGKEKLLYYLGGVDNWFSPQDTLVPVQQNVNWAYQTVATPLRGFAQDIRNGNSFALLNSEIRFPIFHYLVNHPIKSDFFNSFQIIGFGDFGTAWTGPTPYSNENSINTAIISSPGNPITVILNTQQSPFVGGFGGGLRTRILGYFLRFDEGWGVSDAGIQKKPISYFSLSLDF